MNDLLIHPAVEAALTNEPERRLDKSLWVSDLGKNPYSALKRLMTGELEPFDYATRMKMDGGNALEAATLRQVAENLSRPVRTQFPLFNDIWTGYADLVVAHGTDHVVIYDHKGAAGKWWDYKESLPRASDCCQIWMYGELYQERYGVQPELGLYYRGWGTWAEFRLSFQERDGRGGSVHVIEAEGWITGEKGGDPYQVNRYHFINPAWLRAELEDYHGAIKNGTLTMEHIERLAPTGPDWDYAADNYDRLAKIYGR